jgi:hypothetical protein
MNRFRSEAIRLNPEDLRHERATRRCCASITAPEVEDAAYPREHRRKGEFPSPWPSSEPGFGARVNGAKRRESRVEPF